MFAQLNGGEQTNSYEYIDELDGDVIMSVHAIDVGQGDCTLIRAGETTMLIDAGEYPSGDDVVGYLDDMGIKELDYVIGTHPHSDHIGGLSTVLEEINVGCLIIPDVREELIPTGTSYDYFLEAALEQKENGMEVYSACAGETYNLSSYAKMTILAPFDNSYTDINDCSVAVLIECRDVSFFAAGDITHTAEADIMEEYPELKADLIKMSHHGSEGSNLKEFIEMLDPTYAFIGCGKDNGYGHPHESVLDILDECGTKYRRTDIEGSLVYYTDGTNFIEG